MSDSIPQFTTVLLDCYCKGVNTKFVPREDNPSAVRMEHPEKANCFGHFGRPENQSIQYTDNSFGRATASIVRDLGLIAYTNQRQVLNEDGTPEQVEEWVTPENGGAPHLEKRNCYTGEHMIFVAARAEDALGAYQRFVTEIPELTKLGLIMTGQEACAFIKEELGDEVLSELHQKVRVPTPLGGRDGTAPSEPANLIFILSRSSRNGIYTNKQRDKRAKTVKRVRVTGHNLSVESPFN